MITSFQRKRTFASTNSTFRAQFLWRQKKNLFPFNRTLKVHPRHKISGRYVLYFEQSRSAVDFGSRYTWRYFIFASACKQRDERARVRKGTRIYARRLTRSPFEFFLPRLPFRRMRDCFTNFDGTPRLREMFAASTLANRVER